MRDLRRPRFDHHELVGVGALVHQVLVRGHVDLVGPPLETLVLVVAQPLEQRIFRSRSAFIGLPPVLAVGPILAQAAGRLLLDSPRRRAGADERDRLESG